MTWMKRERIYIVPTRFGLMYLLGILLMILVGAVYANNLVNLLAFFLMAIALISMIQTHNNVKALKIQQVEIENGFADDTIRLTVVVENPTNSARFGLEGRPRRLRIRSDYDNVIPLIGRGSTRLISTYEAPPRGRHVVKEIKIASVYPLGLFYAWTWFPTDTSYFVYPKPEGQLQLPQMIADENEVRSSHARTGDDFHGHRKYQTGDSSRHVDWKAYARGRPLLTKEFDEGDANSLHLDWDLVPVQDVEKRLSQIANWIELARSKRLAFSLRLPGSQFASGDDLTHHRQCLEALAAYDESVRSPARQNT